VPIAVAASVARIRADVAAEREQGRRVALVPTMGALHEGHLALVSRALEIADAAVVSIFVNPLQFGAGEDLEAYPRTPDEDLAMLEAMGVRSVFMPPVSELYPHGDIETRISAGEAGAVFEGAARPGHFDGMLTVVAKLFNTVQPQVALFGQKDAQQLFLVRRMVRDLDIPVAIESVPIVRQDDGLALSSRNRYLSPGERRSALALPHALDAVAASASEGAEAALAAGREIVAGEPLVDLDYLAIVDPATFRAVGTGFRGQALAVVAAKVGGTRLIDNQAVVL